MDKRSSCGNPGKSTAGTCTEDGHPILGGARELELEDWALLL